jgi:hypothetical protein
VVDVMHALDGDWRVVRTGGLLPPLRGVRKHIEHGRGWTIAGPVRLPFEVAGLELRYQLPLRGLVDTLTPEGPETYFGTTTVFGRYLGNFRMIRG